MTENVTNYQTSTAAEPEVRSLRRFVVSRRPPRPEVVGCHWFRRNLRVYDNPSLLHAFAPPVTTVFTFYILGDDFSEASHESAAQGRKTEASPGSGASTPRQKFLIESLADLNENLKKLDGNLFIFKKGTDVCDLLKAFKAAVNLQVLTFERETHADLCSKEEEILSCCKDLGLTVKLVSARSLWDPTKIWDAVFKNNTAPAEKFDSASATTHSLLPTTIRDFAELVAESAGHPNAPVWPLADLLEAMSRDNLRPLFLDLELTANAAALEKPSNFNKQQPQSAQGDPAGTVSQKEAARKLKEMLVTTPIANLGKSCRWESGSRCEKRSPSFSRFEGGETAGRALLARQLNKQSLTKESEAQRACSSVVLSQKKQKPAKKKAGKGHNAQVAARAADADTRHDVTHAGQPNHASLMLPYICLGCVSVRTYYHAVFGDKLPKTDDLARAWLERVPKLLWREYMYFLASKKFTKMRNLLSLRHSKFPPWIKSESDLARWKQGITGYPYVDAVMRQLMQEGWVPTTGRVASAMFLILILWQDPQDGVDHFVQHSIAADLSVCQGNFSWIASPRFCIHWLGGCVTCLSRFILGLESDPPGTMTIRKYVPELRSLPESLLHAPWQAGGEVLSAFGIKLGRDYPHRMTILEECVDANREKIASFLETLTEGEKELLWNPAASSGAFEDGALLPCTPFSNIKRNFVSKGHYRRSASLEKASAEADN